MGNILISFKTQLSSQQWKQNTIRKGSKQAVDLLYFFFSLKDLPAIPHTDDKGWSLPSNALP